jgi:hypothetical protein
VQLPTLRVEAGFAVPASVGDYMLAGDEARGLAGVGTAGPDVVFTDITPYFQQAEVRYGITRMDGPIARYEPGTAEIVLNNSDGRFDPSNTSGPYASGGVTQVTPMRAIRIIATWASIDYDVWRGFLDEVVLDYPGMAEYATATFRCTDAMEVLGSYDRVAGGSVGAGEDTGARIDRILDSVGWPATDRIIAAGDSTLQATTLEGNALEELQLAADSELGELYIDGAGRVVFRNRHALLEDSRSRTSQATFGDGGGSELPYAALIPTYDKVQMANLVQVSREGGSTQTASDATSRAAYLTRTYPPRSDLLLQTDAAVADWAGFVLYQSKDPELRFAQLTVMPQRDPASLYPQVLGRRLGDRITVIRRPPGGHTNTRDVFIRGVAHDITPSAWRTTWQLQSATKYAFMVAGDPILGRAGLNAAAF